MISNITEQGLLKAREASFQKAPESYRRNPDINKFDAEVAQKPVMPNEIQITLDNQALVISGAKTKESQYINSREEKHQIIAPYSVRKSEENSSLYDVEEPAEEQKIPQPVTPLSMSNWDNSVGMR